MAEWTSEGKQKRQCRSMGDGPTFRHRGQHMTVCVSGYAPRTKPGGTAGYDVLSQQSSGAGLFSAPNNRVPVTPSERSLPHGRKKDPLQNLSRRERDAAELVQRPGGHEEQARSAAQSRHAPAHDGRGTERRVLRGAGQAGTGQRERLYRDSAGDPRFL